MLDEIERSFVLPGKTTREQVVTSHRLQAFSPLYFQGDQKLFSYSEENMRAASNRQKNKEPESFLAKKLDMSAEEITEWRKIDIDMLCMFFSNPTRFLLEKRMGIFLGQPAVMTAERENFELSAIERYTIEQNLINSRLSGLKLDDFRSVQRAMGQLPPGQVGDYLYNEMSRDADIFFNRIESYTRNKIKVPLEVDLEIGDFRVIGRLSHIYEPGYIHFRFADQKAKDLLKIWICHLFYCELRPENRTAESFLISKDRIEKFQKPSNPGKILEALLEFFGQGLTQPLQFFPETSLEYMRQIEKKPEDPQRARAMAKNRWIGHEYKRGENEDPYYYRCFKNEDPIDDSFAEIAKDIYLPLLAHHSLVAIS
jgi:exodeoxyribonuclease V gamma subunit